MAHGAPDHTITTVVNVEVTTSTADCYYNSEPDALAVGLVETSHTFGQEVKQILIIARGVDIRIEFDANVTADSVRIPAGAGVCFARACTRLYAIGSAAGTAYLVGFW